MNVKCLDKCLVEVDHSIPVIASDGKNASDFYRPDVIPVEGDEFRNYGGYPRNELAIINEQQNLVVAQALCDKLVSIPDDTKTEKQVSDVDLRLSLRSRYCQTPSEQQAHYERLLEERDARNARIAADRAKKAELAKIEKEKADLWNSLTQEERDKVLAAKRQKELDSLVDD